MREFPVKSCKEAVIIVQAGDRGFELQNEGKKWIRVVFFNLSSRTPGVWGTAGVGGGGYIS